MSANELTKEIEIRPSSVVLWISIMAGPIAWAIDLESRFALVQWACFNHRAWVLDVISTTSFVGAVAGALLGWLAFRRLDPAFHRARFMAICGFVLGCAFALSILASAIPHLYLSPCD
jgi:predicted membrane protein